MISRRSAIALAEVYAHAFHYSYTRKNYSYGSTQYHTVNTDALYDFLYAHDFSPWFCNQAKKTGNSSTKYTTGIRKLKEFVMRLHTGETQADATHGWTWDQRKALGQDYLHNLAEDILNEWFNKWKEGAEYSRPKIGSYIEELLGSLELDRYVYRDSRLLSPESDVLDVEEETGVLQSLHAALKLANGEIAFHHLRLSEDHYLAKRWDDSISNSRKFLECALQEVAAAHSLQCKGTQLPKGTYTSPFRVRDYLEDEGLLETKEKKAIAAIYGLLSETGGHPYMAQNDQARLLRHLALTVSQFVMLRFQGSRR